MKNIFLMSASFLVAINAFARDVSHPCPDGTESVQPELQKAEITIEFIQKHTRSITDSSPIILYKKSLSLGGQVFAEVDSSCGRKTGLAGENIISGMRLPQAPGVDVDSAAIWFSGSGSKYLTNPRIKYLLEKNSLVGDERSELIAIYSCLWETENPSSK